MQKQFLARVLFIVMGTSLCQFAEARFVENGQICSIAGRHQIKRCRPPKDQQELQAVLAEQKATEIRISASNKFDSCGFSMFKGWPAEIGRLQKNIESKKFILGFSQKEIYWANEDLKKSAYLPSETVRAAAETVRFHGGIARDAQIKISTYQWCIQCAMKSPKGYQDCN